MSSYHNSHRRIPSMIEAGRLNPYLLYFWIEKEKVSPVDQAEEALRVRRQFTIKAVIAVAVAIVMLAIGSITFDPGIFFMSILPLVLAIQFWTSRNTWADRADEFLRWHDERLRALGCVGGESPEFLKEAADTRLKGLGSFMADLQGKGKSAKAEKERTELEYLYEMFLAINLVPSGGYKPYFPSPTAKTKKPSCVNSNN